MSKKFTFSIAITVEAPATEVNEHAANRIHALIQKCVRDEVPQGRIIARSFGTIAAPSTMSVEDLVYTMQRRGEDVARLQFEIDKLKKKPRKP